MSDKPVNRGPFLLLVALFFGPMVVAMWLYFGTDIRPSGQTHHGHLLEPVRPLPVDTQWRSPQGEIADDLEGDLWTLLQFVPSPCEDACQNDLYRSRQVWLALDRRRTRVQRIAVVADAEEARALAAIAADADPNLKLRIVDKADPLRAFLRDPAHGPGTFYVIDPIGNWVLWYDRETNLRDIHTDFKKLLRLSKIG